MQGLTEPRCPECCRAFDPADPRTMNMGKLAGPVAKWLMKPPSWPLALMAILPTLLMLYAESVPGGYFSLAMLALMACFGIACLWALRVLIAGGLGLYYRDRSERTRVPFKFWRWFLTPTVFGMGAILLSAEVPLRVAVWVSMPAMERVAQQAAAMPPWTSLPDQRIGWFNATRVTTAPDGVIFLINGSGFMDRWGFVKTSADVRAVRVHTEYDIVDSRTYPNKWQQCREIF